MQIQTLLVAITIGFFASLLSAASTPQETIEWLTSHKALLEPQLPLNTDNLEKFTSLTIERKCVQDAELIHLVHMKNLESLSIYNDNCKEKVLRGDQGFESIGSLNKLTFLDLDYNQIRAEAFSHLSSLTQLKWLKLQGNKLGGESLDSLGGFVSLEYLVLSENNINESNGPKTLSGLIKLPNLKVLMLSNNALGTQSFEALSQSPSLESLSLCSIGGNTATIIDEAGAYILGHRFSKLKAIKQWCAETSPEAMRILVTSNLEDVDYFRVVPNETLLKINDATFIEMIEKGKISPIVIAEQHVERCVKEKSFADAVKHALSKRENSLITITGEPKDLSLLKKAGVLDAVTGIHIPLVYDLNILKSTVQECLAMPNLKKLIITDFRPALSQLITEWQTKYPHIKIEMVSPN